MPAKVMSFVAVAALVVAACTAPRCRCRDTPSRPSAKPPAGHASRPAHAAPPGSTVVETHPDPDRMAFSVPRKWPGGPRPVPLVDVGVFDDLASQVRLRHPSWLAVGPAVVLQGPNGRQRFVLVDGAPVAFAVGGEGPVVGGTDFGDRDGDGIPDGLDILVGAKKVVLNGAEYRSAYRALDYPRGDVPRGEGVCSDVIVRALRNAGFDLQELVSEDIARAPTRYPMVASPDRNIDHRRVQTLLPYFTEHWTALPVGPSAAPFVPGDICFLNTMHGPEPEHMGIVSDRVGSSGLPLLVNNWNDGTRTNEMDLLGSVPVTHRFRAPARIAVRAADQGLGGLLARRGIRVPDAHDQLVLVHVPTWDSTGGRLGRYSRADGGAFSQVGEAKAVRIGARGLGRGRGLHGADALGGLAPKREGDKKAPAGLFALGTAFGPRSTAPYHPGRWPWRTVDGQDRFVDDPASPHYNSWQRLVPGAAPTWDSAERLLMYELGVVVEHNTQPAQPGAGSAIFIHTWKGPEASTIGCTALARADLEKLLGWLDPAAEPVLVQVAGALL